MLKSLKPTVSGKRIIGLDVARALALFGMVIVNFKIAQGAVSGSDSLKWFASIFEGRASALFVILAGIGVSIISRSALESRHASDISNARKNLIKRGLLLVIVGLAFSLVWPADILHFYGFYFLLAAMVFTWGSRSLLWLCVFVAYAFPVLLLVFDYAEGWDWDTLHYHGFWTPSGMFRHILFNGFHPVIPWSAFLIFGLWLGRQNLGVGAQRQKLFITALLLWICTESVFNWFRPVFFNAGAWGLHAGEIDFLFSTEIIPPMPQYLLAAGSLAAMIIIFCLYVSERLTDTKLIRYLSDTGQMALSLYILHVIFGMGLMEATGTLHDQSIEFSLFCSLAYCAFSLIFSVFWMKHVEQGPMEWIFRRLIRF